MFASITTAPIKEGKWDELARLYQELLEPGVGKQTGLTTAYLLKVPGENDGLSIAIYETESQARASAEPGGLFADVVPKMAHCFAGQPERTIYEIVGQV